jgi:lipid A 3-O-deacylase
VKNLTNLTATLATAATLALPALAQEKSTLSLTLENDSFLGTDRYYTQGMRVEYLHRADQTPDWAGKVMTNIFNGGMSIERARVGFALGQEFYTPSNLKSVAPVPGDRPYAGWLHGSVILRRKGTLSAFDNIDVQDEFELDLGVVGPESFSEETQRWWHGVVGYDTPRGWANQLETEPAVQTFLNRSFRFGVRTENDWGFDVIPHLRAAIGNVYVFGELGVTLRAGYNLPRTFVRSPMESYNTHPGSSSSNFSAYLFTGVDGRVVGRNLFLDGNTWTSSPSVDKELFVADMRVGGAIRYSAVEVVASLVHRTREFKTQTRDENFISITTQFHF